MLCPLHKAWNMGWVDLLHTEGLGSGAEFARFSCVSSGLGDSSCIVRPVSFVLFWASEGKFLHLVTVTEDELPEIPQPFLGRDFRAIGSSDPPDIGLFVE